MKLKLAQYATGIALAVGIVLGTDGFGVIWGA
jgi:hypothetical protein